GGARGSPIGRARRGGAPPPPPPAVRLAPSLERGPQPVVKPEAIDRRRGGDRVDTSQHHAVPLEAALFEDAARGRIGYPCAGLELLEPEILEGVVDQGSRGLGRIALAPIGGAKPVPDFRRLARRRHPQ